MSAEGPASAGPVHIRMVFVADPLAVRTALHRLIGDLEGYAVPAEARGAAEIVLAEALNNIVEHAYAEGGGEIDLTLEPGPNGLHCAIHDRGSPLPGLALPSGSLPAGVPNVSTPQQTAAKEAAGNPDNLPEGGFGWFLIRTLARDLNYDRVAGQNRLTFSLPTAAQPPGFGDSLSR